MRGVRSLLLAGGRAAHTGEWGLPGRDREWQGRGLLLLLLLLLLLFQDRNLGVRRRMVETSVLLTHTGMKLCFLKYQVISGSRRMSRRMSRRKRNRSRGRNC